MDIERKQEIEAGKDRDGRGMHDLKQRAFVMDKLI